jgi:hypothetical protein
MFTTKIDQDVIHYNRDIFHKIEKELRLARKEILVAAAWFTDNDLLEILLNKRKEGVVVDLILADNPGNEKLDFDQLSEQGASVLKIKNVGYGMMHQKFCVIDRKIAIHGSYNWSVNAKKNNHESVIVTNHKETVEKLVRCFFDIKNKTFEFLKDPSIINQQQMENNLEEESEIKVAEAPAPVEKQTHWIENDKTLANEAVYWALTGSNIETVKEMIKHYYNHLFLQNEEKRNGIIRELESHKEKAKRNTEKLEKMRSEIKSFSLEEMDKALNNSKFFNLAGAFALYLCMSLLIFGFFAEWTQGFFNGGILITLGIYIFATFNLFNRQSFLFKNEDDPHYKIKEPSKWRVLLEEVGIPVISALLLVLWAPEGKPILLSIVVFAFATIVFLYSGKAIISYYFRLKPELDLLKKNRKQYKRLKEESLKLELLIEETEQEIREDHSRINELNGSLQNFPSKEYFDEQRDFKFSSFQSEYKFALSAREHLDTNQIKEITLEHKSAV